MVVAAVGAPFFALLAQRPLQTGYRQALAITFFSLWLHDVLDMLQSTDRVPLWPVSSAILAPSQPWLPSGLIAEATLFGGIAAVIWAWQRRDPAAHSALPVPGSIIVASIIGLAALTSYLRDRREADAQLAHYLVEESDAHRALPLLDRAERWPSPSKPGRIDYLRGAAYNELGDRAAAERFYLLSLRKDPSYFWAVVDLAVLYAEDGGSMEDRRRRAAPYVERLRRDFAGEAGIEAVLSRIERKLASNGDKRSERPGAND